MVEGNRRVATLKYLERRYEEDAIDLGKLDAGTFSKLPVVLYQDASERDHLVMMGLHPYFRKATLACHQPCTSDGATTPALSR